MVAGGYDALTTWFDVLGFWLLGALTSEYNDDPEHASRPFDRDRSGFVLGEGGVVMVLEELEAARGARRARSTAELARLRLEPERLPHDRPAARRRRRRDRHERRAAGGRARHRRTWTTWWPTARARPAGDISETMAIKRVFGEDASTLVVTSPKSMTGHITCAAGALNLLAGICAMRDGVVSPTINVDNPDPTCDLDYVPNEAREMDVDVVLVNAFAFGGTNGCAGGRRRRRREGRRRWTTLDRIVRVGDGEAEAIRNVPNTLAIFDSHFPRFPVMPGVLILGSLGKLCAELLEQQTGRRWRLRGRRPRAASATSCSPATRWSLTVKLKERGRERGHAQRRGGGGRQGRDPRAQASRGARRGMTECAASPSPASGSARRSAWAPTRPGTASWRAAPRSATIEAFDPASLRDAPRRRGARSSSAATS